MSISAIIIDDNQDAVEVFQEYLEVKGIDVLGVGYNGKEAVELFLKLRPDVVFIDVTMPYYDGFYALEKVRKLDHDVKIIMVTADSQTHQKKKIFELNADAIATKPYDIEDIVDVLEKITNQRVSPTSLGSNI